MSRKKKRFVLRHFEYGIFIGEALGVTLWSKKNPLGQHLAATFFSRKVALQWVSYRDVDVKDVEAVEVETSEGDWATIEDCAAAGLERWEPMR